MECQLQRRWDKGWGALERLSGIFQIYSILKWGTVCYCKIYADTQTRSVQSPGIRFRALNVSKPGQTVSGDGFQIVYNSNYTKIFMVGSNFPAALTNHETHLSRNQCLIMSSDGIRVGWELSQFPSILRYDPLMLAAVIYKGYARKNDDMSILIAKT